MGVPIRPLVPIRVAFSYLEETLVEEQSSKIEPVIKSIKTRYELGMTINQISWTGTVLLFSIIGLAYEVGMVGIKITLDKDKMTRDQVCI